MPQVIGDELDIQGNQAVQAQPDGQMDQEAPYLGIDAEHAEVVAVLDYGEHTHSVGAQKHRQCKAAPSLPGFLHGPKMAQECVEPKDYGEADSRGWP